MLKKKKAIEEPEKPVSPSRLKLFIKKYNSKIKAFSKKVFESGRFSKLKEFLINIIGYGVLIAFSISFIKSRHFLLSAISWGIVFYFIKEEFVEWIRRIIEKR